MALDNTPTTAGIAWDSIDRYDGDRLKDWDVLQSAAAITTDTLRHEVDA